MRKSDESRTRIAVDQEIEATSSLEDLINPKSMAGKDFSDCEELDLMMAAELTWCYDIAFFDLQNYQAWSRQKTKRAKHSFTERKTEECFQRKTIGLGLVEEETLVVFYTRMPRETVMIAWDDARNSFSPRASILFSSKGERHRLT